MCDQEVAWLHIFRQRFFTILTTLEVRKIGHFLSLMLSLNCAAGGSIRATRRLWCTECPAVEPSSSTRQILSYANQKYNLKKNMETSIQSIKDENSL